MQFFLYNGCYYTANGDDECVLCRCSGSVQQLVSVLNHSGDTLNTVKYHEGFMGQRIAPVTCIAFHPVQVALLCRPIYLCNIIWISLSMW